MVSHFGGVVAEMALVWWLVDVADMPALLAVMELCAMVLILTTAPFCGALADRLPRKTILVLSDLATGLIYGTLGLIIWFGDFSVGTLALFLVTCTLLSQLGREFYEPASKAAIVELVHRENLNLANATLSTGHRITDVVGRALGGVLYHVLGLPLLLVVNAISYLVSGVATLFIKFPKRATTESAGASAETPPSLWDDVKAGFRYVVNHPGLARFCITYAAFMFFNEAPRMVLMPIFLGKVLNVSEMWFGYLMAAYAIGGVLGGIVGGIPFKLTGRQRAFCVSGLFFTICAGLGTFVVFRNPYIACGANAVIGACFSILIVWMVTTYQMRSTTSMLGRVFALQQTTTNAFQCLSLALTSIVLHFWPGHVPFMFLVCALGACVPAAMPLFSRDVWKLLDWNESSVSDSPVTG